MVNNSWTSFILLIHKLCFTDKYEQQVKSDVELFVSINPPGRSACKRLKEEDGYLVKSE